MELSRRTLLKLFTMAPALGVTGSAIAKVEALLEATPADAGTVVVDDWLGFSQNGGVPVPLRSVSVERSHDFIDVTCIGDEYRSCVGLARRSVNVIVEAHQPFDMELSKFEVRVRGATIRFSGFVEQLSHDWNHERKDFDSILRIALDGETEFDFIDEPVKHAA